MGSKKKEEKMARTYRIFIGGADNRMTYEQFRTMCDKHIHCKSAEIVCSDVGDNGAYCMTYAYEKGFGLVVNYDDSKHGYTLGVSGCDYVLAFAGNEEGDFLVKAGNLLKKTMAIENVDGVATGVKKIDMMGLANQIVDKVAVEDIVYKKYTPAVKVDDGGSYEQLDLGLGA